SPERLVAAGVTLPHDDTITRTEGGAVVVCSRLAGVTAYDLLGSEQQLQPLLAKLAEQGLLEVDGAALNCVRIAAGTPWFHDDLVADIIPLEALLKSHVSVTKGCYPGQEIVARITNRGQVSRKLVRLTAPAGPAPAPGAELSGCAPHEGKAAGLVTSSCIDPVDNSVQALGYVRRLFFKSQTPLTAGGLALQVHSLDGD
ncbi:MAG: folate-binding protein YgfZ, partial [Pseudohongiellaceae bacterium]